MDLQVNNVNPTSRDYIQNNVSYFAGASHFIINGGTFTTVANDNAIASDYRNSYSISDREWLSFLRYNTAPGAFHDSAESYDAPKCHPHTRETILQEIMDWVRTAGKVDGSKKFLWLHGPFGSGKTSIARTIAEMCQAEDLLAADFFFSRTSPRRNNITNLISTLAYQLITLNPRVRKYVADAISHDTLIFSHSPETQLYELIIKPLTWMVRSFPDKMHPYPYLIILDALDECSPPESQKYILSTLSSVLRNSSVSLIFLIASRPELMIRGAFNGSLSSDTRHIVLDNDYQVDEDIKRLLQDRFEKIKYEHPLASTLPPDWPGPAIDQLVRAASGQFVYASTVMKFIESPRDRPTERLNMILNLAPLGNSTPFADLDAVYKSILMSIEVPQLKKALTVFAFIFMSSQMRFSTFISSFDSQELQTAGFMELFLGYEPQDLVLVLGDLHSLVEVPPISTPKNLAQIRLFHPSFGDFLQNRGRAGPELFIDIGKYGVDFARLCIAHLTPWLYTQGSNFPSSSAMIQYAFRIFLQLFSMACSDDDLIHDLSQFPIDRFIEHMFDGWLPVFSLIPLLFNWLKNENLELYNRYTAHYNDHIRSRLLAESTSATSRWQFIYTAVTLNVSKSADFSTICKLFVAGTDPDHQQATIIQTHLFGEMNFLVESLDITDYLSRLKGILTDHDQSGGYFVDESKYCELGVELFDMFTGKCPNILDDLSTEHEFITNIFRSILDRIPNNQKLAKHLHDNQHRNYVSFLKTDGGFIRLQIKVYIQNCIDLFVSEDRQASTQRPAFSPVVNYLSAPPPNVGGSQRGPSSSRSSQEDPNRNGRISPPVGAINPVNHSSLPHPSTGHQTQGLTGSVASTSRKRLREKGKDFINKMFR